MTNFWDSPTARREKNPMRPPPDIQKTPTSDSRRNRPRAQHRQALVGRGHWHCQMHSYSYSKCYTYNYQLHGYSRSRNIIRDYTAACSWKTKLLEASSSRILIHSKPPTCTWEGGKGHCPHYPHFLQRSWGPLVVVFRSGGWPLGR